MIWFRWASQRRFKEGPRILAVVVQRMLPKKNHWMCVDCGGVERIQEQKSKRLLVEVEWKCGGEHKKT